MKKNNNIFWIGLNSFFTDFSSEMIKPILPLFLSALWAPALLITLFFNVSEFLSNVFKILFGYLADKTWGFKSKMMIWYAVSNLLKPFMWVIPAVGGIFAIEALNKLWKWIRTAPKEVIMKNSIAEDKMWLWFWFQKAMDSLWAFVWTIVATWVILIFWYSVGVIQNMFLFTIIPWLISAYIIYKYVKFEDSDAIDVKTKKPFSLSDVSKIGGLFSPLMFVTVLSSVANVGIIFYMLSLMKFNIPYYWITWMYSLYMLTDSVLWFYLWKVSDGKNVLIKNIFLGFFALLISLIAMVFMSVQSIPNSPIIYVLGIFAFISYGVYESVFDTWFKKLISLNSNKEFSGTALGFYSGIGWITKIVVGIPFALVFSSWGGLVVYATCIVALMLGVSYFITQISWVAKTN